MAMPTLRVVPKKGWSRGQKALLLAAAGVGGYALYRYYRSDNEDGPVSVAERMQHLKRSLLRLPTAMANYYSAYLTMSQMAKLLSADLHTFLVSETAEVPGSLKQCGRLLEAGATLIARAAVKAAPSLSPDSAGAMLSNLLETLDTPRGRSLLGFVLERACQESVRTFVQAAVAAGGDSAELNALPLAMMDKYFAWASSPAGEATSCAMVSAFATSGVEAYMQATEGGNIWEDLFSVLSKPQYAAFLGMECELSTRAFVMSLFEAIGRGGRPRPSAQNTTSPPQRGSASTAEREASNQEAVHTAPVKSPLGALQSGALGSTSSVECVEVETVDMGIDAGLWASAMVQMVKVPEVRQMVASLCGSATSAGVRATVFSLRDMVVESPQTFIVLLAIVFGLPMYFATRHAFQVIP